jgi:hypothetical protein
MILAKEFYVELLENELNPLVIFNSIGKIKSCNKEAEFLLNFVSNKELFNLAIDNASKTFGFNQKYISLQYNKLFFYAILVGYKSDDEIILRLYKVVSNQANTINQDKLKLVNIYSLIDLSKSTTLMDSELKIEELYDVSIPDMKININDFLIFMNHCFLYFIEDESISLQVQIKIGEYEIINDKKYKIIALEFSTNRKLAIDSILEEKATKANANIFIYQNKIVVELPIIL